MSSAGGAAGAPSRTRLSITGIGMITSVGHDAVSACAAIRAGIARPAPVPRYLVAGPDGAAAEPAVGHPVRGFNEGFAITGAWLRLGLAALADLQRFAALPASRDDRFWSRTGLLVVAGLLDGGRFGDEDDEAATPAHLRAALLGPLIELSRLPIRAECADVLCLGHAGALLAVPQAEALLRDKRVDRVIVLGVDSYLDTGTLEWLDEHDRLKTPENPAGLMPGEAAACFLLEPVAASGARPALAEILGVASDAETFTDGRHSHGTALRAVVAAALEARPQKEEFAGPVFTDLNGENWRAQQAGAARVGLRGRLADGAQYVFPAQSCGDTGAASGALLVCAAARALQRGYAGGSTVLVTGTSEDGRVAAACVAAPQNRVTERR